MPCLDGLHRGRRRGRRRPHISSEYAGHAPLPGGQGPHGLRGVCAATAVAPSRPPRLPGARARVSRGGGLAMSGTSAAAEAGPCLAVAGKSSWPLRGPVFRANRCPFCSKTLRAEVPPSRLGVGWLPLGLGASRLSQQPAEPVVPQGVPEAAARSPAGRGHNLGVRTRRRAKGAMPWAGPLDCFIFSWTWRSRLVGCFRGHPLPKRVPAPLAGVPAAKANDPRRQGGRGWFTHPEPGEEAASPLAA